MKTKKNKKEKGKLKFTIRSESSIRKNKPSLKLNESSISIEDEQSSISTENVFDFEDVLFEVPAFEPVIPPMKKFQQGSVLYRILDKRSLLVHLALQSSLTFTGRCSIKVLKGTLDISGYRMTSDDPKEKMFSPKGQSLLSIRCVSSTPSCKPSIFEQLSSLVTQEEVEGEENVNGAAFILEGFDDPWIDVVRKYSGGNILGTRTTGIGPLVMVVRPSLLKETLGFNFIKAKGITEKHKKIEINNKWDSLFNGFQENVRLALFGGKAVGKSTLNRWLLNRYLSRRLESKVLYIDLDPGQPEFTSPGLISITLCSQPLLGPNFTHISSSLHSEFLGSIKVNDIPLTYIIAVKNLKTYLLNAKELRNIPWIINTMGYNQGLGVDFACEIIKILEPTDVIQITTKDSKRNFPFLLSSMNLRERQSSFSGSSNCHEYSFITVDSFDQSLSDQTHWGISPADSRDLLFISYFASIISSSQFGTINSIIPFKISLKSIGVSCASDDLSYKGILKAMNGNLVGLFKLPPSSLTRNSPLPLDEQSNSAEFSDCLTFKFTNDLTQQFLGFGIVRHVDLTKEQLYLVAPFDLEFITEEVNGLITAGRIGLPISFLAQGGQKTNVPYLHDFKKGGSKLHKAATRAFMPTRAHI